MSSFGLIGVSMGISNVLGPHAIARAATEAPNAPTKSLLFLCGAGPVIDFLEQFVVLTDLLVVRLELERLLVSLARLFELSFVLVRDREIVVSRGVVRVDLNGALPAIDGFAPQPALRDVDPEL